MREVGSGVRGVGVSGIQREDLGLLWERGVWNPSKRPCSEFRFWGGLWDPVPGCGVEAWSEAAALSPFLGVGSIPPKGSTSE